jgi:hypothetical protein
MKLNYERGLTLVELLLGVTLLAMLGTATGVMVSASLEANRNITSRSGLYQEGLLTMTRITAGLKKTTFVLIPNSHGPTRNILAFSRLVNDDNDFYFGDPLFPRIDEDLNNYFMWASYGIQGIDDDNDGLIDDGVFTDDDEDNTKQEEILNGIDDDGDGSIDEDVCSDMNLDGAPGIQGIDDDGDGQVDEMQNPQYFVDDDEDGVKNEEEVNVVMYSFDSAVTTLSEIHVDPRDGIYNNPPTVVLSNNVTNFEAFFEAPERIRITLTLTGDDGESVTFIEYVCPRNVLQKTGKRVR